MRNALVNQIGKQVHRKVQREQKRGTKIGQSTFDRIPTPENFQISIQNMKWHNMQTITESPIEPELEVHYKKTKDAENDSAIDKTDPPGRKIRARSKSYEQMVTIPEIDYTTEAFTPVSQAQPLVMNLSHPPLGQSISWSNLFEDQHNESFAGRIINSVSEKGL